ncbi:MAG TPA: acetylxylan esterase [Myxococcota bacterium]|nr:acetylxylan esterase [Myxococcota bacterium]HQK50859.1 acetylxylan esterase [Myxococcota bacterium]
MNRWCLLLAWSLASCGGAETNPAVDIPIWEVTIPEGSSPGEDAREAESEDLSSGPREVLVDSDLPHQEDLPDPGPDPDTPTDPGDPDPGTLPDETPDSETPDIGPADTPAIPDEARDPGPATPWQGLFDPAWIRDATTADCTFTETGTDWKDGVQVRVFRVSYLSWESRDGVLVPIRIRGFASRPLAGSGRLPGIVQAHGLGGMAEERHATGTAALTGAFVLACTGPGGGTDDLGNRSEGLPAGDQNGYRLFDTLEDPRGSWFWGNTVAALRGLTCLATRPDVDPERLGMTGFSAGGVATLMGAGVDDRIQAAVPLSASGAWDVAVQAPNAWQHALLRQAGLDTGSPEWTRLIEHLDSARLLPDTRAKVLMVNGSADEFFPLTAHRATWDAIPGGDKRTALVGNFDHGCYTVASIEPKEDIEARAERAASGGQWFWFHHVFGTDSRCARVPEAPAVPTFANLGGVFGATTVVDSGGASLKVVEARLWISQDAKVWVSRRLEDQGGGLYMTPVSEVFPWDPAGLVSFVDVIYATRDLIGARQFSLSSPPTLPAAFVPDIRSMETCL